MKAMYALRAMSTQCLSAHTACITEHGDSPVVQAYEAGASIVFSKNYYVR